MPSRFIRSAGKWVIAQRFSTSIFQKASGDVASWGILMENPHIAMGSNSSPSNSGSPEPETEEASELSSASLRAACDFSSSLDTDEMSDTSKRELQQPLADKLDDAMSLA